MKLHTLSYISTCIYVEIRARVRVVPMIHLITEKPDPPAQCVAAARDNSANARPRACIRSQLINTRMHCLRDKVQGIYLSPYLTTPVVP